ncbi:MAG: hypothetical protein EU544_02185 [Promethearchaeota archaeon]|nr:MAG: hypothetical protein EU544_02185 [Candidatus Lokiarchaeota archaeon]
MADFLLLYDQVSEYSKKDIDKGQTPLDIYTICCAIREGFCLSYSIRKDNTLYFFLKKTNCLVKLEGRRLRYLGSDERSQALLFGKALDKLKGINSKESPWVKSTPGIYVRTFPSYNTFLRFMHDMTNKNLVLIFDTISAFDVPFLAHTYDYPNIKPVKKIENLEEKFFILSEEKSPLIDFIHQFVQIYPQIVEKMILTPLKRIEKIEDKILYINFQIDQQRLPIQS